MSKSHEDSDQVKTNNILDFESSYPILCYTDHKKSSNKIIMYNLTNQEIKRTLMLPADTIVLKVIKTATQESKRRIAILLDKNEGQLFIG